MTKPHVIHVNRQFIAMNAKDGGKRPVFTVKHNSGKTIYGHEVEILGPSKMVNNGTQLKCGARVWMETHADLNIVGACSFAEAKQQGE